MIRRHWNDLRIGHHVLVHDETDPTSVLVPGRVIQVDPTDGSNDVTIRISPPGRAARVVQPRRLAVHLDSGEPTERCWRCEIRYGATSTKAPERRRGSPT